MRLIDADVLRQTMYHEAFETDSYMQKWDGGCWIRYKMFENGIESAPTIDAVPVVHGEWIEDVSFLGTTTGGTTVYHGYHCSVCGGLMGRKNDLYCYKCGAKMRGENNG